MNNLWSNIKINFKTQINYTLLQIISKIIKIINYPISNIQKMKINLLILLEMDKNLYILRKIKIS